MDGLQDICPSVSMLWVSKRVRQPARAPAKRRLGPGVAAADHDDIESSGELHRFEQENRPKAIEF